jgi:hypothetical protein
MTTDVRRQAIRRIMARQTFYLHLATFLAMGIYLTYLWAKSGSSNFWPIWGILGWGIGLASHGMNVFSWDRGISEERIQREIDRTN